MVKGAAASGGPMTYACADNESWNFKNFFTFVKAQVLGLKYKP